MKLYSLLLLFSLPFLTVKGDDPINYLAIQGPLKFNENSFELVWSANPNKNYFVHEYIPKGETIEHFNEMLTLNLFVSEVTVDDAVQQRINDLNKNKSIEVSNVNITESPDGKEKILDCMITTKNEAEFIIYRFKQIELSDNKKGLIIYSYSKRNYDAVKKFKADKTQRTELLNAMIATAIPNVKINSKSDAR